jgi:hypothetical protein
MEQKTELTKQQLEAAHLLFDNLATDQSIAGTVGIDVRTLRRWKEIPEFHAVVTDLKRQFAYSIRNHFLSAREARLSCKFERHRLLNAIIKERADAADPTIPGASTGLLIKRTTHIKDGTIEEYRIDHVTLRELDRLEDDIACELGQHNPPPAKEEEDRDPDYSCLNRDELNILEFLENKIAAHNPWMLEPLHYQLFESDQIEASRLIDKVNKERQAA